MELHWQSRVLSKSPVLKKFQLSTPNTDGVWAVDISCVHPTLSVVSSFQSEDHQNPKCKESTLINDLKLAPL